MDRGYTSQLQASSKAALLGLVLFSMCRPHFLTAADRPRRPVTDTTSCHGFDICPHRLSSALLFGCGGC